MNVWVLKYKIEAQKEYCENDWSSVGLVQKAPQRMCVFRIVLKADWDVIWQKEEWRNSRKSVMCMLALSKKKANKVGL